MKKVLLASIFILILSSELLGVSNVGTTSGQFLKIGVGMRATSMGEAFVGLANDASAVYWNPAGTANLSGRRILFNQINYPVGLKYSFLGFTYTNKTRGTFGGYISLFSSGDMKVRTEEQPEGTGELFSYTGLAVALTYAKRFTDRFSFGGALKYIQESVWHSQAATAGLDLSLLFKTGIHGVTFGMSLSNFGGKMQMRGEDTRFIYNIDPNRDPNTTPNTPADLRTDVFSLPLRITAGISGMFLNNRVVWDVDFVTPNDNYPYLNAGVEANLADFIFLRVGRKGILLNNLEGGLTAGAGFKIRKPGSLLRINVDYSYLDFGRFNSAHRLGLELRF